MEKFFTILLFISFIPNFLFAQSSSPHQREFEKYSKLFHGKNTEISNSENIAELVAREKEYAVFGYLPFWELDEIADDYLRYDILTHISVFAFSAEEDGSLTPPYYWPWNDVINQAHIHGVKVVMTVVNFDAPTINIFLHNDELAQSLRENILAVINEYKLDGVNIDFEAIYDSDEGEPINSFMSVLSDYLKTQNENLEISFAAPAINWNDDWDFVGLAAACDYIFIMGYDFYGSWSDVAGPVAPLTGGEYNVNLQRTIYQDYWSVVQSAPEKLILGVPYYGAEWICEDENENSNVIDFIDNISYKTIKKFNFDFNDNWSDEYSVPWLSWQDSTIKQVWYDNDSSLALKYDLVLDNSFKGAGMWALGYDDGYEELWQTLEDKFGDSGSGVETNTDDKVELLLDQNYPNPFGNGAGTGNSTVIRYGFPNGKQDGTGLQSHIKLTIYNALGEVVQTLVDEKQYVGVYKRTLSMNSSLPSGVYFYTLNSNGVVETKKFVYLR